MRSYGLDPYSYILGGKWASNFTIDNNIDPKALYESMIPKLIQ